MIVVQDLSKRFGKRQVLHSINLRLDAGIYGLLGPNGAGKTTLLRCMVGLFEPEHGRVLYHGEPIDRSRTFHQEVGYLPQAFGMFRELTLYEMMDYICSLKGIPGSDRPDQIATALRHVNLEERAGDRIKTLSGGMVRRAGIAQALLGEPRLLLLDEPTAGLDPGERASFKNLIGRIKKDRVILLSTHIVEDVEACCDYVIVLDRGRVLFQGTCEELRRMAEGKVYQVDAAAAEGIAGPHFTLRISQVEGRTQHRILAREPQDHPSATPTLEDGYMCLIKGLC